MNVPRTKIVFINFPSHKLQKSIAAASSKYHIIDLRIFVILLRFITLKIVIINSME